MEPISELLSPHGAPGAFRRILVAVDPAGASENAVAYTAHLCASDTQVLVVGFFEDPAAYLKPHSRTPAEVRDAFAELRRDELAALDRACAAMERNGASVERRLLGPALGNLAIAEGLARAAQTWNADLVVVGAEVDASILGALATKVSVELAEHTHRAILVIPRNAADGTLRAPRRLLFAVDGSEASMHAVRVGMQLASPHAALGVLYVEDRGIDLAELKQFLISPSLDSGAAERALADATAIMSARASQATIERLTSHTRMTEDVAAAIKREAGQWAADIVIVGAEDRNGMFSWFRGHENERVARSIDRPLLVINAAG